jgi:hypothetical protein
LRHPLILHTPDRCSFITKMTQLHRFKVINSTTTVTAVTAVWLRLWLPSD